MIRSTFTHARLALPLFLTVQATAITLLINNRETLVSSVYIPLNRRFDLQEFHVLSTLRRYFILAGDYNAKHPSWNSRLTLTRGRQLFGHAEDYDYSFLGPQSPTHFPTNPAHRVDVLDIFALKTPVAVIDISTLDELNSVHSPVLLVLDSHSLAPPLLEPSIYHSDWTRFTATLTLFVNTILTAHRSSTIAYRVPYDAFIPDLKPLIREKKACRRRWQRLRYRADKQHLNYLNVEFMLWYVISESGD